MVSNTYIFGGQNERQFGCIINLAQKNALQALNTIEYDNKSE